MLNNKNRDQHQKVVRRRKTTWRERKEIAGYVHLKRNMHVHQQNYCVSKKDVL